MAVEVQSVVEKTWKPNTGKQATFLSLPDSIFEGFYGGAAGGGKTEALLMFPILRQFIESPKFKGILLRRTFSELEESVIQRSKVGGINKDGTEIPSFYDFGGEFNEQKKRWTFPSKATFTFGHCEEEDDIRKYDTAEYQYGAFDELTSFTEFQYRFMVFSRLRSVIPGVPPLARSASNPGNIGHRWVRERFVEPCLNGGKVLVERIRIGEQEELIKRIFIQAFLSDNPKLMENDPMYRVRMEMLPEAERRAKAYGDWFTFSGQAFNEWRTVPFVGEPDNACHIIPPFTPDPRLPRVLAIDWGYSAMTYALFGVPLPKKRAIAYKEFSTYNHEKKEVTPQTVKTWTTHLANECMLEGIDPYIALDPSAWQNRGQGQISDQFIETWKEVTGKFPKLEKAENDRPSGKMLVHDYLRWKPRPKLNLPSNTVYNSGTADWIFRNKGIEAHKAYLNQFAPQDSSIPEVLPRLLVTSNCQMLIKTIPLCIYDEKKANEDIKEFSGDDPYDDLRYFLKRIDRFNLKEGEFPNLQGKEVKEETVENINHYYRQAEITQAKKKGIKSISLGFRRRR